MVAVGLIAVQKNLEPSGASAQASGEHHPEAMSPNSAASDSPSTTAYRAVSDQMHTGMGAQFTGNADVDFMRGMVPPSGRDRHGTVALQYGKDQEVRTLTGSFPLKRVKSR